MYPEVVNGMSLMELIVTFHWIAMQSLEPDGALTFELPLPNPERQETFSRFINGLKAAMATPESLANPNAAPGRSFLPFWCRYAYTRRKKDRSLHVLLETLHKGACILLASLAKSAVAKPCCILFLQTHQLLACLQAQQRRHGCLQGTRQ